MRIDQEAENKLHKESECYYKFNFSYQVTVELIKLQSDLWNQNVAQRIIRRWNEHNDVGKISCEQWNSLDWVYRRKNINQFGYALSINWSLTFNFDFVI